MTKRRPLALGAAAAIGLGSLFIASPAMAVDTAPNTQDPIELAASAATDIQAEKGADTVVGYGATAENEPIVLVSTDLKGQADAIEEIAAKHNVEKLALVDPAVADDSTDVVGGAGYVSLEGDEVLGACSLGFSAWSPTGAPALITAGHCQSSQPGQNADSAALTLPSSEPAVGGEGFEPDGNGILGSFGFAQFGGPGNTNGAENDPNSIDIAVIDVTSDTLKPLPEVTDWTTAGQDDLAASTTLVKGVSLPKSGTISKSGRTSGITSGSTELELEYSDGNVYPTEILDGYVQISGRWVHGFIGGALTDHGDSGGAVFQGDQAVGVVSGGPEEAPAKGDDWAWYSLLEPSLEHTGGYTVAVHLDKPVVDGTESGDSIEPGDDIVVKVPAPADTLIVSTGSGEDKELPVKNGKVVLQAPENEGQVEYTFTAKKGFDTSEATQLSVTVADMLDRPTFKNQELVAADGETSVEVKLSGTGEPGATVNLPDDATAEVDADGNWEFEGAVYAIGDHKIVLTQTLEGETSAKATGTVKVSPAAPKITSIKPGQSFPNADAPTEVSGTGLAGATLAFSYDADGVEAASEVTAQATASTKVAEDGTWTAKLNGKFTAGSHTVSALQSFNEVDSEKTTVLFSVETAPSEPPTDPEDPTDPTDPGEPNDPNDPAQPQEPGDELPLTGGVDLLPFGLTAGGLVLLGTGALVFAARRLKAFEG